MNKYYYNNPNQNQNEQTEYNKDNRRDSDKNPRVHKSLNEVGKNNYQKNRKERIVNFTFKLNFFVSTNI